MKIKGFTSKNLLEELDQAVHMYENPWDFESYCGACDNFETEQCPFRDKVSDLTEWKRINCKNFWD